MNKYQQKHIITLSESQKLHLQNITNKGKHNVRVVKRAKILLNSARGRKDSQIAESVEVCKRTVEYVRARFAQGGLERALYEAPRPGQPRKIDDKTEAYLIALACSTPPKGHAHWTLELLQKKLRRNKKKNVSTVTIWQHLNDRDLKPWREKNVVHTKS
ncbi:MAG: helix-turn-helix domain-containing protein [Patescibacteria group bacterium]